MQHLLLLPANTSIFASLFGITENTCISLPRNEQDHNQQTLVAQFERSDRVNLFFVVPITKSAHTADFLFL